jgi:hypothetical protein
MEKPANLIVLGSWFIFLVYWMVSSLKTKRIAERQSPAANLAHRLPVALSYWIFPDQYPQYRQEVKALVPWIL